MNNAAGWIKLHRKLLDWEWYTDIPVKTLFIHLLLRANHAEGKWRGITISRGELVTSLDNLSKETGLTKKQVRNALLKLNKTGEISSEGAQRYTRIKCLKYSVYQDFVNDEGHTEGTQRAYKGHTEGTQRATNNNNKNNNNKKNDKKYRMKSKPTYDIEAIKYDSMYNDDYDI